MKPYIGKKQFNRGLKYICKPSSGSPTFKEGKYTGFKLGISKLAKLVAKNANRSLKKRNRQELKSDLLNELENLC